MLNTVFSIREHLRSDVNLLQVQIYFAISIFINEEEKSAYQCFSSLRSMEYCGVKSVPMKNIMPCFAVTTTNYDSISDKFIAPINREMRAPKRDWKY